MAKGNRVREEMGGFAGAFDIVFVVAVVVVVIVVYDTRTDQESIAD